MTPTSISGATEVYRDVSKCEIIRHWIEHPGLAEFSLSLRAFIQLLGDEVVDEFWRRSLGPIRRLGFTFCSTPLPFTAAAAVTGINWAKLHQQERLCEQLFPDAHEVFANLVQQLKGLSEETGSPFIEPLEQLHQQDSELCIAFRNPRMNQVVADLFAQTTTLENSRVVSPAQLGGEHLCNILAVIGPCSWFPESIFLAPRATAIHVISPSWIRDAWKPGPIFLHDSNTSSSESRNHCIGAMPRIRGNPHSENYTSTELLPEDLLPPMPNFNRDGPALSGASGGNEETVLARLCHLSGERAVFVASDDGSSSLVIDTSERGHTVIKRIPIEGLETGLFLLIRTSGGGDFIAPLADRIMRDLASNRRAEQAEWKNGLVSAAIAKFGLLGRRELSAHVSSELRLQNLSGARPANVHYWMASKSIRPRKKEDFTAILAFAGMENRSEELWEAMGEIDRAHRAAGHAIRKMLLQRIAESSLEPLERDGEMVLELGDEGGGTLSAFEITEIVAQDFEVPADQIGVLLEMED